MPDDDARQRSGERFAADLRARREERGLSAEELREKLHVPSGLFEAFESGRLVGHPMFNRVYLRSLTRSYADTTDTPPAPALAALDATLNGNYEEGQLQREIEAYEKPEEEIAEVPETAGEETSEDPEENESASEAAAGAAGATGAATAQEEKEPDWVTSSPPGASAEEAERREREKEERARERERQREERARQQEERRQQRAAEQQQSREQQAAAAATQQRAAREEAGQESAREREEDRPARSRSRRPRRGSSSNAGRWIAGLLVLAGIAVGLFFLVPALSGGGGGETAQTAATASDTAAGGQQGVQQQDQQPAANLQIGETMNFTVVAADGPVQDLKVTRDQDVRRPYWIEEGQATVFPAQERIVIQNPPEGEPTLQNVRLLAEGYPYPTDQRDAQGRIVITRQSLQSFADTLRGQPAQIPAQRDTAALFNQ